MKAHPTDWLSLLSGLVFIGIGTGAVVSAETNVLFDARWIGPALLLVIGVGMLTAIRGREARTED